MQEKTTESKKGGRTEHQIPHSEQLMAERCSRDAPALLWPTAKHSDNGELSLFSCHPHSQ